MIETLVPQIVKALREYEWPETDCSVHFRLLDWTRGGNWYHPLWLAQMVVALVQKEADLCNVSHYEVNGEIGGHSCTKGTLSRFGLTPDDWTWLKGKVDENS